MRLAVLSDIHGNITALDAVMADLADRGGADVIWVLGDLAVFGPSPVAVMRQLRDIPYAQVILGNTDRYLITGRRPAMYVPDKATWERVPQMLREREANFLWTVEQMDYEWYEYLAGLGTSLEMDVEGFGKVLGYHASPGDDERGIKPDMPDEELSALLEGLDGRVFFFGHTHIPMDRRLDNRRVINPGSVGLPFDGDNRASYSLVDFEAGEVSVNIRRVPYDVERAIGFLEALDNPGAAWTIERLRRAAL